MFSIRECHRGSSLSYPYMISRILKHFCINKQNVPWISPDQTQELNTTIMANMRYMWDNDQKVYYFYVKGTNKRMYNYHDPIDVIDVNPVNVEE